MAMTDLIPWKKPSGALALRQREMDPFARMRQDIDQMFGDMLGDWTGRMNLFNRVGQEFMPMIAQQWAGLRGFTTSLQLVRYSGAASAPMMPRSMMPLSDISGNPSW